MPDATQPRTASKRTALLAVLLVALTLRPALTSVGPILPQLGEELSLGPAPLGMLGAIPLLCFAGASWLVHALAGRIGHRSAVTLALAGIAVGIVLRSLNLPTALWVGTVVLSVAIAIGNVVVSGLVKRDFAGRVSLATGAYAAVMGIAAALGSGLSAPLAAAWGSWRLSLAVWAVPTVLVLLVWVVTSAGTSRTHVPAVTPTATRSGLWRSGLAWQVTAFFGLQSMAFYLVVTWLPTMAATQGLSAQQSGWLLFWFQVAGVTAGPVAAALADRLPDQRLLNAASGVMLAAAIGAAIAVPSLLWLWVGLAGVASGASFSLGLALPPLRTSTPSDTVRLAGMAQSVGYLIAAAGPVLAGWLAGLTNWGVVLAMMVALALIQATFGFLAGADRTLSPG